MVSIKEPLQSIYAIPRTLAFMFNNIKDSIHHTVSFPHLKLINLGVKLDVLPARKQILLRNIVAFHSDNDLNHLFSVRLPGLFEIRQSAGCAAGRADSDSPDKPN